VEAGATAVRHQEEATVAVEASDAVVVVMDHQGVIRPEEEGMLYTVYLMSNLVCCCRFTLTDLTPAIAEGSVAEPVAMHHIEVWTSRENW
jgi:hypothetical protein